MPDLNDLLKRALDRREALVARSDLNAYRLLHAEGDGVPGLVIERLGPALIVQLHQDRLRLTEPQVRHAAVFFHEHLGTRAVYRKFFVKDRARATPEIEAEHHRAEPWIGEPIEPEVVINELGLQLIVRPYDGFSTGLFLEQRENRRRVRELSAGKRVLNTFSYTCAFSAAAAAGGASAVDSVDLYKRYLEWGKVNFAANGLDTASHWFFQSDVLDFYRRAQRQDRRYDLVILDPPTFARLRRPHRTFVLSEQLDALCSGAAKLLGPQGVILLSTNDRGMTWDRIESALRLASVEDRSKIERLALPPDFAGDPGYSRTALISFRA